MAIRRFNSNTLANNINNASSRGEMLFPIGDTRPNSPGFSPIKKIETITKKVLKTVVSCKYFKLD